MKINWTCNSKTKQWDNKTLEIGCFPVTRKMSNNMTEDVMKKNIEIKKYSYLNNSLVENNSTEKKFVRYIFFYMATH